MTMDDWLKRGVDLAWMALLLWWFWSARGNKEAARGEPWHTQVLLYWLPLVIAFVLLGPGEWFGHGWLREGIFPHTTLVYGLALVLVVAGVGLACWSRYLLGRNWSSVVQIKRDHDLIDTGPYRYVRHPIYTSLLLAFVGTALKEGDVRGIFAVAIVFASFWRKLRMEERMLGEAFGPAYTAYRNRTKALIPGVL
jgi:protein-S-isoprenylcysteine O-methyltransferase Ste14